MRRTSLLCVTILAIAAGAAFAAGVPKGKSGEAGIPSPFDSATFLRDWIRTTLVVVLRGDVLVLDGTRARERLGAFRDEFAFSDVQMATEFLVDRYGRKGHCFGLVFASTDSRTYHALEIGVTKLSLVRVKDGKTAEVLASKRIRNNEGRKRRLRLTYRDGQFYAYYQDEVPEGRWRRVFDLKFSAPPGRIGVYAEGARIEVQGLTFSGQRYRMKTDWKLIKGK